jgi:Putative peptidoglycan binding domain
MMTASEERVGTYRLGGSVVAYTLVLVVLGLAGIVFWTGTRGSSAGTPASAGMLPAVSSATQNKSTSDGRGLSLPPRPMQAAPVQAPPVPLAVEPRPTLPAKAESAIEPVAPLLLDSETGASTAEATVSSTKKPTSPASVCTPDLGLWPADRTGQVKVIQILLRDLGFYTGTTYGTMGPATRAAIGKFQLAGNEAETGEPTEILFEQLRKKCVASGP